VKTVVISDIHARPKLLLNALEHAGNYDSVVFAGDALDIGADPEGALRVIDENCDVALFGNHDICAVFGVPISPQDSVSFSYASYLRGKHASKEWKFAYAVDGVIITHAGISSFNAGTIYGEVDHLLVASDINRIMRREFDSAPMFHDDKENYWLASPLMDRWGCLWYRPSVDTLPGFKQVAGHTPDLCYTESQLKSLRNKGLRLVDPYARSHFGEDGYYKYATITDGKVRVHSGVL